MLILNPSLMANMDDGHLIRSLECEPSIMRTPVELELMARCERLAEELAERPEVDTIEARVSEAIAQYPEEDFLEKLADRVFKLGEKLRGDNKAEAHAIAMELTELGQQVANAAAYGREELDQILNPKKEPAP
jgi:hypothetical protein